MVDLIIACEEYPRSDINVIDLDITAVYKAVGGRIIIKELPYYPPISCTQDGCDEFAEHVIVLIKSDENELPMLCTLCTIHKETLLRLNELDIPVVLFH